MPFRRNEIIRPLGGGWYIAWDAPLTPKEKRRVDRLAAEQAAKLLAIFEEPRGVAE